MGIHPLFLLMEDFGREIKEKVERIILESGIFKEEDYQLIDIEVFPQANRLYLRVLVNKIGGINIDECANLNRLIGDRIDEANIIEGSYILEVSSPGIDREIRKEKEFKCLVGRQLKIKDKEGKIIVAELKGVKDRKLFLETKNKTIVMEIDDIDFALQVINGF